MTDFRPVTKEQERARAKRRYERRQDRLAERQAEQQRMRVAAIVAVLLLALVGAFIAIAKSAGSDKPGSTSSSPASPTAPSSLATAAGCSPAPGVPGTAAELTKPDAAEVADVTGKRVIATIDTNCGQIVAELDGTNAPLAVASFVQLARLGYWKDAPCPRVTAGSIFVLQCGDPTGSLNGSPGYGFAIENAPADNVYKRGVLAMARQGDNAEGNGGQYFIVYRDSPIPRDNAGGYTVFGSVLSGMDIVDKIAAGGAEGGAPDGAPAFPISTLSVTTETKD